MQRNLDIREAAQNNAVMLWEIADKIGIADSSFSRKLRRELPQGEKQRIFSAIEEIAKEKSREKFPTFTFYLVIFTWLLLIKTFNNFRKIF